MIIEAINAKKNGLSNTASSQEIAAYITANWAGGSSSGNITYIYHEHNDSCYGVCGGYCYVGGGSGFPLYCSRCGQFAGNGSNADSTSICTNKSRKCGKDTSYIDRAIITY